MSGAPRCVICAAAAVDTIATATDALGDPVCDVSRLPGDLPLAGAVAIVRDRVWPELREGVSDD